MVDEKEVSIWFREDDLKTLKQISADKGIIIEEYLYNLIWEAVDQVDWEKAQEEGQIKAAHLKIRRKNMRKYKFVNKDYVVHILASSKNEARAALADEVSQSKFWTLVGSEKEE